MRDVDIIFAPGTGGNHLANMLSMAPGHSARVEWNRYHEFSHNVHPDVADGHAEPGMASVRCFHLAQWLWQNLGVLDRRVIVLEFAPESRNALFELRVQNLDIWYHDHYLREELSTLYSIDMVRRLSDAQDLTVIPADLLFDPDVTPLVQHVEANLDLRLPKDQVAYMHGCWIRMISGIDHETDLTQPRSRYDLDSESDE